MITEKDRMYRSIANLCRVITFFMWIPIVAGVLAIVIGVSHQ